MNGNVKLFVSMESASGRIRNAYAVDHTELIDVLSARIVREYRGDVLTSLWWNMESSFTIPGGSTIRVYQCEASDLDLWESMRSEQSAMSQIVPSVPWFPIPYPRSGITGITYQ